MKGLHNSLKALGYYVTFDLYVHRYVCSMLMLMHAGQRVCNRNMAMLVLMKVFKFYLGV